MKILLITLFVLLQGCSSEIESNLFMKGVICGQSMALYQFGDIDEKELDVSCYHESAKEALENVKSISGEYLNREASGE